MSGTEREFDQNQLFKAMAHPLRVRILEQLNEQEATPSALARQLHADLGDVSYHVQVLLRHQAIELVDVRPGRGAVAHVYRALTRPFFEDSDWVKLPVSMRRALFNPMLQKIWDHVVEAACNGGLDDPQTHISWTTLDLDSQGYDEMVSHLAQALTVALEIHARAAGRIVALPEEQREAERTELVIMHYHRPRIDEQPRAQKGRGAADRSAAQANHR